MSPKNNLLLINVDHWPGGLLNCAGKSDILTPTLDQLAGNGIRFTNFYSECPVCIPARRSLMTGLAPRSHGDRVYRAKLPFPDSPSLAQTFVSNGYQAYAVGKLHVYPQRDRIGFNDVILAEEARYSYGVVDDYQIWLAEQGFVGQEYTHGMSNNSYHTRTWHLPEHTHATNWVTMQMAKTIKRRDPTRPAFFYASYQHPHPPLVPLATYFDMYKEGEPTPPICGNWVDDSCIMRALTKAASAYSRKEIDMAKRAFYAQCTHIDHQIRLLIGTLREEGLLDSTVIAFTSDHGDMLFDHNMVAKRVFYEGAAKIPFIISGKPMREFLGSQDAQLGCLADVMPTLLDLLDITPCESPTPFDGIALLNKSTKPHDYLFCEISEGMMATRMITNGRFKLIYYPCGNLFHMFDLQSDPHELRNIAYSTEETHQQMRRDLERQLTNRLYGDDTEWVKDGVLVGFAEVPESITKTDYGFSNQRGFHWPAPNRG